MPNRVIKESICDSERINRLTPLEEITFYRLLVNADDYGCFDAREMVVKSRLFPLREIKASDVKKTVERLAEVGLINLYTVKGKPYLIINKWAEHQRLRVSRHKYPTPDEADEKVDCRSLPQVAASCGKSPPESESESESESEKEMRKAHERRFEKFWSEYPRRVNKQAARKAFDKLKPTDELLATMTAAIAKQKLSDQWTKDGGQFIPHPATWLNGKRWEDELTPAENNRRNYEDVQASLKRRQDERIARRMSANNFEQRDYSGVNDEIMRDLKKDMDEFRASDGNSPE